MKDITSQRYVLKLNSQDIINSNYEVQTNLNKARKREELISLSESDMIRYIDYLNGQEECRDTIRQLKLEIKHLKKCKNLSYSRPIIKRKYAELDALMFKKDYVEVVMKNGNHHDLIVQHKFSVKIGNAEPITYVRMVGTPNGVKKNTVVFVNEQLHDSLVEFVANGRNLAKAFVPAKLEAYNALTCSASTPVSQPHGVLVVHDCVTHFLDTYIKLDDTENPNRPAKSMVYDGEIELDNSDGCGMADPELMARWAKEIGEEHILPGCVIRNSFCKGAVFPIDFKKYCREHYVTHVEDVWGEPQEIENIELILTDSMLKLWDSYDSIEDYLSNCEKYRHPFSLTKNAEYELENERCTNYQFIQSYEFSDEDIDELIKPTVDKIKDVLGDDYRRTILYTKGVGLNEHNTKRLDGDIFSALMVNDYVTQDPYFKSTVNAMINKRINDAKIGVLDIEGNYSLVSGDLYSLCQSMCGFEVTGLLKAGEVYSKYWADRGVDEIAVFRAPMTSHNNIRKLKVRGDDEVREFYKYVVSPTVFNSWDMCANCLNGMDYDGDCTINTCNQLLIDRYKPLPAIECIQRSANKIVPSQDDLAFSNKISFGNAVGAVTNRITNMFEVQAGFNKDSDEYKELEYRIQCGQLYQQNAIDKTKGIDANPMPNSWYSWFACQPTDDDGEDDIKRKEFDRRIVAEKKPYFMKYRYAHCKKEYDDYIKNNEAKCRLQYRMSIAELEALDNKSPEQLKFLDIYKNHIPLGTNPCVINRICWKIENEFDNRHSTKNSKNFDYTIYKNDLFDYPQQAYEPIKDLYRQYRTELKHINSQTNNFNKDDAIHKMYLLRQQFDKMCYSILPNKIMLCNLLLDICYKESNLSKKFVWDICGNTIIENLLEKSGGRFSYPTRDEQGDIKFNGLRFKMVEQVIEQEEDDLDESSTE